MSKVNNNVIRKRKEKAMATKEEKRRSALERFKTINRDNIRDYSKNEINEAHAAGIATLVRICQNLATDKETKNAVHTIGVNLKLTQSHLRKAKTNENKKNNFANSNPISKEAVEYAKSLEKMGILGKLPADAKKGMDIVKNGVANQLILGSLIYIDNKHSKRPEGVQLHLTDTMKKHLSSIAQSLASDDSREKKFNPADFTHGQKNIFASKMLIPSSEASDKQMELIESTDTHVYLEALQLHLKALNQKN